MKPKQFKKISKIVVVLPTYNEKTNITKILPAIFSQQKRLKNVKLSVLVVDDNSPDGTGTIVKRLLTKYPRLSLLKGNKKGLGVAYKRGFTYAIQTLKADAVMEMDADFSHNPKDIPRLIFALQQNADVVIGSRYISGGSIPANWPLFRKLNSAVGNILAKNIIGMNHINDLTGGFRAIRAEALQKVSLSSLSVSGYVFQVYLLFSFHKNRAAMKEIPIHFTDRTEGTSKMSFADMVEFVFSLIKLRLINDGRRIRELRGIRRIRIKKIEQRNLQPNQL